VVRDLNEARIWLDRASENGSVYARSLLERVDEELKSQGSQAPRAERTLVSDR
jgi:hypothetical protein